MVLSLQKETLGDLLMVNGQLSQAGVYTCTAQTVVDSASSSAKLVVRGETQSLTTSTTTHNIHCIKHTCGHDVSSSRVQVNAKTTGPIPKTA